ncbi:hypothetical protein DB88DRAFT_107878 [Papiliotrema laurentii]|uniref:Uncharacterized protein n=1 Tax=Papiliotrema laurentii TaxID=5418 RepID=A0AAD9FIP1_PAPLA|nr:hypothetical protein DB88DRAFT_107878 [Papiliotrema laurentii]
MFYNPAEYRRGRTDTVKDISRSNSREARSTRGATGSRGRSIEDTPSSSTIPIPATPLMTPSRPPIHSSASSIRSTQGRSLRTYQDDPMNSPPRPESALRRSSFTDSHNDETPQDLDDLSHDDLPSDFFSSDRPIRQSPFISACSSPAIAVADHDVPDLAFDMDLDNLQDPFAPPPRHLPRVSSATTPLSPLLLATPARAPGSTSMQRQGSAAGISTPSPKDTSGKLFAPDTVTREDLRQFEQRQTELLRSLMVSKRAREGLAPPPYRPTRPDWVPEWV